VKRDRRPRADAAAAAALVRPHRLGAAATLVRPHRLGAERERLWAGFRDYPGWGADIDALAARRGTETAVVVLERRTAAGVTEQP
jgi:hypothetical protein